MPPVGYYLMGVAAYNAYLLTTLAGGFSIHKWVRYYALATRLFIFPKIPYLRFIKIVA
jgi:hypothetical protein